MKKNYFFVTFLSISIGVLTHCTAQQNSLLFDGVDDKVTVPVNAAFNSANTLTLEAWINATAWKPQVYQGTIIGKDATNQSGYVLRCGANGLVSFNVGNSGGVWTEVTSTILMQANIWNHVAGVFDNGTMTIYINGNFAGSTTSNPIAASALGLVIGDSPGYPGRVFNGLIDEVRVWNVARTLAQIQYNDTVDLPNNEPGLVGYYKFNQVTGITTPNEISATTNSLGTLVNFPANPWGPGYVVGGIDMSANSIQSPDRITFFSGASRVRAKFKNNGTDTISNFLVGYQLGTATAVVETVTQTLFPNQELDYAFHSVIEGTTTTALKVFCTLTGDYNPLNDTVNYTLLQPVGTNNVIPLFTSVRHDFGADGQSHTATVPLPDEDTKFSQILMTISLACPTGGCDPWDQPAKISLLKNGQSHELLRFITPYHVACGPWTVDVTDFKSWLVGACNFESYIQVWGPNGWLLNCYLTYVQGPVALPYQKVTRLWETDNWVYGDPAISYDLPAQTIATNAQTQELDMRMTNSGHGQANTDNAAEFSNKIHSVEVNSVAVASHHLWKTNCATNSCTGQMGTFQYSRAGWCPGQEVQPFIVNLTPQLTAGSNITVDYVLQPYINLLNTGYNGNGHTEPHYKIHAFLVEKSNVFIDGASYNNAAATRVTFPLTNADLTASTQIKVMIHNTGTTTVTQPNLYCFVNGAQMLHDTPAITLNPGDSVEYVFTAPLSFTSGAEYHIAAMIDATGDQASSDDVALVIINSTVGLTETVADNPALLIFPNPTKGEFTLVAKDIHEDATIKIVDMLGKNVFDAIITKEQITKGFKLSKNFNTGTYLVQLQTASAILYKKLVIE